MNWREYKYKTRAHMNILQEWIVLGIAARARLQAIILSKPAPQHPNCIRLIWEESLARQFKTGIYRGASVRWQQKNKGNTVKEEIFVGEKIRTFRSKTFRMELNFVLSEWLKEVKTRRDDWKVCKPGVRKFGMEINVVLFSILRKLRN